MQHYNLTPDQWAITSRIDRKILQLKRAMERYYEDIAMTKMKAKHSK